MTSKVLIPGIIGPLLQQEYIKAINWPLHNLIALRSLAICLLISIFYGHAQANDKNIIRNISKLDNEFISLSHDFFQDPLNRSSSNIRHVSDINALHKTIKRLADNQRTTTAILYLHRYIDIVKNNIDHEAIPYFINLLLNKNELTLANILFGAIKIKSNKPYITKIKFIFAKYHARRNEWSRVTELLGNNFKRLDTYDEAYAYLLYGTALQQQDKYNLAIRNYKNVSSESPYYRHAKLNIAIANIKQNRLRTAQITIHELIDNEDKSIRNELLNRIYLILGYVLLQKDYYQEARDAFRKISLRSRYTSRALLGIGLAATSQGDYSGGLNALTLLTKRKTFDLSVDESYLLLPYIYEKLQQDILVSNSYSDAINYYKKRLQNIDGIANHHKSFLKTKYNKDDSHIIINNNIIDYNEDFPVYFIGNYNQLLSFYSINKSMELNERINNLLASYDNTFQIIINSQLYKRKEYLKSYLNQSRFGLARLFDSTNEAIN